MTWLFSATGSLSRYPDALETLGLLALLLLTEPRRVARTSPDGHRRSSLTERHGKSRCSWTVPDLRGGGGL
jgi:predicted RNA polymerase sigma factor